ncbi:MAG: hypothetical protein JXA11_00615 [Phycisphaerae bacterium]|nr:hypothetical protein [Phycisphaerae bacterium]
MSQFSALESRSHRPNWEGLLDTILREGTPDRVYHIELFQNQEIQDAVAERYDLTADLDPNDPDFEKKKYIAVQRFCGFDYVRARPVNLDWTFHNGLTDDATAGDGKRCFRDEHRGPITTREEFEAYPWPNPYRDECYGDFDWFQENLPDDMCIIAQGNIGHFAEHITWLPGYETFCYMLYDQRDLLDAIARKLEDIFRVVVQRALEYSRVKMIWASDDMGYKTGLLMSADDTRSLILKGHKVLADMSHAAGRPYLLHSCGKLTDIYEDLIEDVNIDAKHSFEDTIEDVRDVKRTYGRRLSLLGGIDVDFLCRRSPDEIRKRVRETLDVCQPGGGYCLGTGNSVASYIPLDNYLAMVDEGMRYGK